VIEILWVPTQQITDIVPSYSVMVENFNKSTLNIVDFKDGHLLWSKLIIAVGKGKLIIPWEVASRIGGVVSHQCFSFGALKI